MKKILSLVVALGVAALFSSATLAGAECNYHKTQAAVTTPTTTSKDVATVPANANGTEQVQTAQVAPQPKPAEVKK